MDGDSSDNQKRENRLIEFDCLILRASWLLQNNYFDLSPGAWTEAGTTFLNYFGSPMYTLDFRIERESQSEMRLMLVNTGQSIVLQPTPLRFGGVRWWFLCPQCERRCSMLYMQPPDSVFLCRLCHQLVYFSQKNQKMEGYTVHQLSKDWRKVFWWRYPPWRRKRDRRPDYRDRGAKLREVYGDRERI